MMLMLDSSLITVMRGKDANGSSSIRPAKYYYYEKERERQRSCNSNNSISHDGLKTFA